MVRLDNGRSIDAYAVEKSRSAPAKQIATDGSAVGSSTESPIITIVAGFPWARVSVIVVLFTERLTTARACLARLLARGRSETRLELL